MEAFIKALKRLFPYNLLFVGTFFALPMIVASMKDEQQITMLLLYLLFRVNPSVSFILSLIFGVRHGFRRSCPVAVAGWFLLSMFFFYFDVRFLLYLFFYTACSAGGCYLGGVFKQHRDEMYL